MWAATQGHLEAVTLLLKAGAKVNHVNEVKVLGFIVHVGVI